MRILTAQGYDPVFADVEPRSGDGLRVLPEGAGVEVEIHNGYD